MCTEFRLIPRIIITYIIYEQNYHQLESFYNEFSVLNSFPSIDKASQVIILIFDKTPVHVKKFQIKNIFDFKCYVIIMSSNILFYNVNNILQK